MWHWAGSINAPSDADTASLTENPSLIGISASDTASFTDTGVAVPATVITSADTASFAEAQSVSFHTTGGPSLPLIFHMTAGTGAIAAADSASFAESSSLLGLISDQDFARFSDNQNFPGGVPIPTNLRAEGFSITYAGILPPGQDPSQGTIFGVRSAQISPQWITTATSMDDQVIAVWNAPGAVQVAIQGGFMPWDVLAVLAGTAVSSSGAAPADYYSLPLFRQAVTGQFPLVLRASGKDAAGNLRVIQFLAYAAQFGPLTFDGPIYKNGLAVSYTATLLLSDADETGQQLPDRAYGRVMSMPAGSEGWTPELHTPVIVHDTDSAHFTETGMAGPAGGTQNISDTDSAHFTEGQRVSSGVQAISDTDAARFTETKQAIGVQINVSDSDFFSARPRQGLVGATTLSGEYGAPTNRMASATQFNTFTSRDMAVTYQEIFYGPGVFPTSFSSDYSGLAATGCALLLCYQPAVDGSDAAALSASLSALKAAAAGPVKAAWYQEPQSTQSSSSGAGWGSTQPAGTPADYGLAANDYKGARTIFDGLIGVASGAAKIFLGSAPGDTPTTPNGQMTAAIAAGLRIYLCYKPAFNPPTATERTNLMASINAMKALCTSSGTGASIVCVILWSEVNNGKDMTAAQYIAAINFYGGAITSAGYKLGHCGIGGLPNWSTWFSAHSFTVPISFVTIDYYGSAYGSGVRLDASGPDNVNTISAGYSPPAAFAIPEMADTADSSTPSQAVITAWLTYIQSFLANRATLGLPNADCIWFNGPGTRDLIISPSDFRIPLLQSFIAAITAGSSGGITAAQFITASQNYYATAHALGIPVVYRSASTSGIPGVTSYFPVSGGNVYCDEASLSYDASTFAGLDSSNGATARALEALARKYGQMPFGFAALSTALSQTAASAVTQAQFTAFIGFVISLMVGRLQTGQFNSDTAWFNGQGTGAPTWNTITSAADSRVPLLQQLSDTLSRAKAGLPNTDGAGESPIAAISTDGVLKGGYKSGRVAQLIGAVSSQPTTCPVSVTDWISHGNATIGPLDADKLFYTGAQVMSTFQNGHLGSDNESHLPAGVVPFVTFTDSQIPSLAQYVASIPDSRLVYLSYWPGAEDTYPGGSFTTFIKTFIQCSSIIRSVGKANVKVFQDSGGTTYGTVGSSAQQGKWLVPAQYVDAYTITSYQNATATGYPSAGLSNYPQWLNWLHVFAGSGRQLGITEYAISNATPTARNARIQADATYLRSAFPGPSGGAGAVSPYSLLAWQYWWSNCVGSSPGANTNQFTDSATITTWQSIVAGTL